MTAGPVDHPGPANRYFRSLLKMTKASIAAFTSAAAAAHTSGLRQAGPMPTTSVQAQARTGGGLAEW